METDYINSDFWRIEHTENSANVVINKKMYFEFLEKNGFGKIYLDGVRLTPTYIWMKNNIVRVISRDTMITFTTDYIKSRIEDEGMRNQIENKFIESILSKPESAYSMLNVIDTLFLSDLKDTIYFCFRNTIIAVERNDIYEIPYQDAPGVIWEDQIIDFDIKLDKQTENVLRAEFNIFMKNISSTDDKNLAELRYRSLISIVGYLIHEYRDLSNMKAIILMDSNLSVTPEGGAGKGLLIQGIKAVRNTVIEDGKNFTFNTRFVFQQVKPSTKVLFFDDVPENFNFERLFSTITDGIIVERKYRDRFVIPAEKSPRIVASTNYAILGNGGSFERRKLEFEFSGHYNRNHTPVDEFGHIFFGEWNNEEWNRFYNFLFFVASHYLNTGLIEAPSINKRLKYLIHATSPEFLEFAREKIEIDVRYDKKTLYNGFVHEYQDFSTLTQRTFTSWLKIYAEAKDLNIFEPRSDSTYYVHFSKKPINPD